MKTNGKRRGASKPSCQSQTVLPSIRFLSGVRQRNVYRQFGNLGTIRTNGALPPSGVICGSRSQQRFGNVDCFAAERFTVWCEACRLDKQIFACLLLQTCYGDAVQLESGEDLPRETIAIVRPEQLFCFCAVGTWLAVS